LSEEFLKQIVKTANPIGIAKLRPPSNCVLPYQAFEAAGFEHDLPRNEIKGRL